MSDMQTPEKPDPGLSSLMASLEPDQLTQAKRLQVPRRFLQPSQVLLLWSMRLYLLFMLIVVIYQVWAGA